GTIVLDHMARLPQPEGTSHAAWGIVKELLDGGRTWVKLSGAYLDSRSGAPGYSDVLEVARAFVRHAPERCVWGSDWPHPTERNAKPDDAVLFDLLGEWAGDEATRHRILVDNPRELYGLA
ncbi:MAG TPA: amidohydrolase family protein, partial [Usitatibacter sp.]|nr:amidohydrolase family protein [Usitatibacter sp.]